MIAKTCKLRRSLAAVPRMHAVLRAFYSAREIDEATAFCLDLAAEEIFTNMVRHNPSDEEFLSMTIEISQGAVHLRWVDRGVPRFEGGREPPVDVTRPIDEREPGGLGLHLTTASVDRLTYGYEDGDMTVDVVKKLGA